MEGKTFIANASMQRIVNYKSKVTLWWNEGSCLQENLLMEKIQIENYSTSRKWFKVTRRKCQHEVIGEIKLMKKIWAGSCIARDKRVGLEEVLWMETTRNRCLDNFTRDSLDNFTKEHKGVQEPRWEQFFELLNF